MHKISLDGAERKICNDCVEELWMEGKPKKLDKLRQSTV